MLAGEPLLAEVEVVVAVVPVVPAALAFVPVDFSGPLPKAGLNWCNVFGMLKIGRLLINFSPLLL